MFFKFFPKNLILRGYQYKLGLNKDIFPFNPKKVCAKSGLYYTDINNLENFKDYGEMIGVIKIPEKIPIVPLEDKYKSPELYIQEIYTYKEFIRNKEICYEEKKKCKDLKLLSEFGIEPAYEICMAAVKKNGLELMYVKNQTDEICMAAVRQDGLALMYVKNQTDEICMEAVKQISYALEYVENQTDEICLAAVKKNGLELMYVKNQTDEICIAAVKQDGYALKYVENQTDEICMEAVKQNGYALKYDKNPSGEIITTAHPLSNRSAEAC